MQVPAPYPDRSTPAGLGRHVRETLALGLPLIGSHLAQVATNLTDTVMLGWYGVPELAASVLGYSVFTVLFLVGSGFAMAVMPMAASAEGTGDTAAVRRVVRMGLWISALTATLALLPMWYSGVLLGWLGQEEDLAALAQDYLRIVMWALYPALLTMVMKSYLSALQRPQVILLATVGAAVLNGLLNYALIFGNWGAPELGLVGAAWATVVAQGIGFGVLALYAGMVPGLRRYTLFARFWRPDFAALGDVFRLGWPIGATMLAEAGLFSATAILVGWVGTAELAAHGIAIQVVSVLFMVHLGNANAATVRAGRAAGQGDRRGLVLGARAAGMASAGFVLASVALVLVFPETLVRLFLDPGDPQAGDIVRIGAGLLVVSALFLAFDAGQVVVLGLLRGLQDTRVPMMVAAVSYWLIGMPACYLFAFVLGLGVEGVWLGLAVGLAVAFAALLWRFDRLLLPAGGRV